MCAINLFPELHVAVRLFCGDRNQLRRQHTWTLKDNQALPHIWTTHHTSSSPPPGCHLWLARALTTCTRDDGLDVWRGENNVAFTLFWGWKCNMWFSLFQHATLLLFRFHGGQIASQSSANIRNLFQILCTCVCMCVCVWQTRGKSSLHNHLKTILISLFSIKKGAKWRRRGRRCRSGGK